MLRTEQLANALHEFILDDEKLDDIVDAVDDCIQKPDESYTIRCIQYIDEGRDGRPRRGAAEVEYIITVKGTLTRYDEED